MCQCSLPPNHIFATEFTCESNDAQYVIYRAKLRGLQDRNCSNLTALIEDWIVQGSSLSVQGNRLSLDASCDFILDALDVQSSCVIGSVPVSPTSSNTPPIGLIAGAATAAIVILILLALILLILLCFCCRKKKK